MKDNEIYRDDEIDLFELFSTLWKAKKKIIAFSAGFLALGVIYTLIATPWYKATALVEIGYYKNNENGTVKDTMLDSPQNIIEKLKMKYIDLLKDVKDKDAIVKSVSEIKNNNRFINIVVDAKSNEEAIGMINKVVSDVASEHKELIDAYISSKEIELANVNRQIEFLKNNTIVSTQTKIDNINKITIPNLDRQIKYYEETIIPSAQRDLVNIEEISLKTLDQRLKLENENLTKYEEALKSLKKTMNKDNKIVDFIILTQEQNLNSRIISANNNIISLEQSRDTILSQTKPNLQNRLDKLVSIDLPNLQSQRDKVLNDTLPSYQRELANLQTAELEKLLDRKSIVELALKPFSYKNTAIVSQIATSESPEKPKKLIIWVISLMVGGMFGVFGVLLSDMVKKRKEQ